MAEDKPRFCATCKHWDRLDADGLGVGNCLLAQNTDGWSAPRGKRTLAFATGERPHDKWANLRTMPNFWCVQWQDRNPSSGEAHEAAPSSDVASLTEIIEAAIHAFEQMDLTYGGYELLAEMREAIGRPRSG